MEVAGTQGFVLCRMLDEGRCRWLALAVTDEAQTAVILANAKRRADVDLALVVTELPANEEISIVGPSLAAGWYEAKGQPAGGRVRFSKDYGPALRAPLGEIARKR